MRARTANGDEIDRFTVAAEGGMPSNTEPGLGELGVDECEGGCSGCSSRSGAPLWWLAGAAALVLGRRRRTR